LTVIELPPEGLSIRNAIELLHDSKNRWIIVVDQGAPVGVFTEGDALRALMSDVNLEASLKYAMTSPPVKVQSSADWGTLVSLFAGSKHLVVPEVDLDGKFVRAISVYDLLER
jgi:CBS domain-containing protein